MAEAALDVAGLRSALHGNSTRLRTVSLYSAGRLPAAGRNVPAGALFPKTSGYRRHYRRGAGRLPVIVHAERCTGRLQLPARPAGLAILNAWVFAFQMPLGTVVLGIALILRPQGDPTHAIAPLVTLLDNGRDQIRLDGDVWYRRVAIGDRAAPFLGSDFHHLTFLPAGVIPVAETLDAGRLMTMVSRREDASRPEFRTVRLPAEANRYRDMACGITPGASVVAGHGSDAELAMTLSAVQSLASLSTLRTVQQSTQETVTELIRAQEVRRRIVEDAGALDSDIRQDAEWETWLSGRTEALAGLELDLSFGVEANLAMRLYVPSLPIEQFHDELLSALGVHDALGVTDRMLSRLTAALAAERSTVASERAQREERRWRTWSAVGGAVAAVAVPVTILTSFLGINASQVSEDVSAFDLRTYGLYYLALLALIVLAVAGGYRWARPRSRPRPPERT